MNYDDIIGFWFSEIDPKSWWVKDETFDQLIKDRFGAIHGKAISCELHEWRQQPLGRLAEIIVLDQFSRNMFRNSSQAFAHDALALALSQEAVQGNALSSLDNRQKAFLLMPFMHSESAAIHELAVTLFAEPGLEDNLEFELKHKAIIDRFGRYPHRNAVLGRESTAEERTFLEQPGSSF